MSSLVWEDRPTLESPVLVAGFTGWNDAADAASDSVAWLTGRFGGTRFAYVDAEEHMDFQAVRPTVELIDGVTRDIRWPITTCVAARTAAGAPDLVLVSGPEPSYRWRGFCESILEVAHTLSCTTVVTLGALLADVPHNQPVRVTGSTTNQSWSTRIGLRQSRYEGPTGIVGVLHDAARRAGMASASLWAPVPHYAAIAPNPPAMQALLSRFADLTLVPIDLGELDVAGAAWRSRVDAAVAADDDLRNYVDNLESRPDDDDDDDELAEGGGLTEENLPSGDALAAQLEEFLREQGLEEGG